MKVIIELETRDEDEVRDAYDMILPLRLAIGDKVVKILVGKNEEIKEEDLEVK